MAWFRRNRTGEFVRLRSEIREEGIWYVPDAESATSLLESLLVQWHDEGYVAVDGDEYALRWPELYSVLETERDGEILRAAGIPDLSELVPKLESRGSLTDAHLSISVGDWMTHARQVVRDVRLRGAVIEVNGEKKLLQQNVWRLVDRIGEFSRRDDSLRTENAQRLAWGEIRRLALSADAGMDAFLVRTIVVAPEKLRLGLRRGDVDNSLVEVIPDFEHCPDDWLSAFDRSRKVLDRYDLPTPDGIVQVVISPEVRAVLEHIKTMTARRVSGTRAEAFLANPFAVLGPTAATVLDAQEFEEERVSSGLVFEHFTAYVESDGRGYPNVLGLVVESSTSEAGTSIRYPFKSDIEAIEFVTMVRDHLARGLQLAAWDEFEFELLGDSSDQLQLLEEALAIRREPAGAFLSFDSVFDLTLYSSRIVEIGVEKPYASPYIARQDESEGWFPDNLVTLIGLPPEVDGGEPRYVPISPEQLSKLRERFQDAEKRGAETIDVPGVKRPVPIEDVRDILGTFEDVRKRADAGELDPAKEIGRRPRARKALLIKPNITSVDYLEKRREALLDTPTIPELPKGLRADAELKDHQRTGVAWLQHLFRQSPDHCRGAVLADDMGLGKTLQLLTLICWVREQLPEPPPALVVAPVALLENWRNEVSRFFEDSALEVLEVYGDKLAELRLPKIEVDQRLQDEGLIKFLRPGWIGSADVVLTTYETLRDHEFSFAAEKWSVVVCDEAQKVKNPNALVTRAAKKQNARFRVACTGTPVENSLADLWSLFDFVQPGLLGALNEFGKRYRRPIEARTDEERERIEELRKTVDPQILRRMKKDVAADLLPKVHDEPCGLLAISNEQRSLYSQAMTQYGFRQDPSAVTPFRNALGLLQYLRIVCTDPQRHGLSAFQAEPLKAYRRKAPKLDWLLRQLEQIKRRDEKTIIFCELRNMQRLLRHYISEALGVAPEIVNGDTPGSSQSIDSRQRRIQTFQDQPGFGVIILSPLAVGFGLNIQAANHVVHYTRLWNPAKEDQATDRAHRIGQTKSVHVYCPIVRAPDFKTFDEKLDELLQRKRALAEDMLNGSGDIGASEFDVGEVAPPDAELEPATPLTMADVNRMSPRHFEAFIAALWLRRGFSRVDLTPSTGDQGVDVVALRGDEGQLIQCKSSTGAGTRLGWEAIKDVVAGEAGYRARYPGVEFTKACVTNRQFNDGTHQQAKFNSVMLIDGKELDSLLSDWPVTFDDVANFAYASQ